MTKKIERFAFIELYVLRKQKFSWKVLKAKTKLKSWRNVNGNGANEIYVWAKTVHIWTRAKKCDGVGKQKERKGGKNREIETKHTL